MTRDEIEKVWLTDTAVHILTKDGREASEKFRHYPRLRWATAEQRGDYELNYYGIHWNAIDEDLSYEGFFVEKPHNGLYNLFIEHPELNASAIARRLGISQSLLAQYISGSKNPSPQREEMILNEIHKIGAELQAVAI